MTVTVELQGFAELEAELQRLSKSAGKAALRRALKKAGEPMVEIARGNVPVDKGNLAASMAISTKLDKRQRGQHRKMFRNDKASVEMFIGPSYNLGAGGRHGHLVEFGTKPHVNAGLFAGSMHPGTAPQPFMRTAWDGDKMAMLDRLKVDLWAEIQKAIARAERRAAGG